MTRIGAGRAGLMLVLMWMWGLTLAPAMAQADAAPSRPEQATNPQWDSLASPQETMFTFLEAANHLLEGRRQVEPRLRKTLDLSQAPDADLLRITEQLKGILDRLGEVRKDHLPNALQARQDGLGRFQYFPRTAHGWVWEKLGHAPEGSIVLDVDEQGQWRFSSQTIAGLERLHESLKDLPLQYEPPRSAAQMITVVGETFDKTRWTGWLTLLGAIFAGLAVGKLVQYACNTFAERLRAGGGELRAAALRDAANPASLILLNIGLGVGFQFIYQTEDTAVLTQKILAFITLLAIGWFLYNLVEVVELALLRLTAQTANKLDDMMVPLIRKALRIFLVIVFTLFVAQNIFDLNITGWLAGLGIAGLAVSLAAQDSVKNLFGSFTIFFDEPFTVGDFIEFNGYRGSVEEIGFRSTRLRLLSGHLVTIPNMKIIDGTVENISRRPFIRREMNVTITYDTPREKIEQAANLLREVLNDPEVVEAGRFDLEKFPPRVAFSELNADSLNIKAFYWYQLAGDPDRNYFSWLGHAQMVNLKLFRAYAEAGIDFAFPTQTLHLAGDPKRQLTVVTTPG